MKKIFLACGILLAVGLTACFIWWYMPTAFLSDVAPEDVARIEVFNGMSGTRFVIEDTTDIEYIVGRIGDVKMRKEEWEQVDGFVYSLSFYGKDGARISHFILNDEDIIRDGNIEYETAFETDHDPLCFYYIRDLEAKQ